MSELIVNSKLEQWSRVCTVDDLIRGSGRSVRFGTLDLALFRLSHDAIVAVENRCPHNRHFRSFRL